MLRVDISVQEGQFREATGKTRFDDDPQEVFFNAIDANQGALNDEVNRAVRTVLNRTFPNVDWTVTVQQHSTPMTQRGRYARSQNGEPLRTRGPAKARRA
jgi:hypothetical protein